MVTEEEESQDEGEIDGRSSQAGHGLGMNLADTGLIHYSQAGSNAPGEGRAANSKKQGSYENEYVIGHIDLMVLGRMIFGQMAFLGLGEGLLAELLRLGQRPRRTIFWVLNFGFLIVVATG